MTTIHYNNYDGAYGYDLISIRLYHQFFWGSMATCSLLSQLYWYDLADDYANGNDVDLLYDDDDDVDVDVDADVNDDYACGVTFGSYLILTACKCM